METFFFPRQIAIVRCQNCNKCRFHFPKDCHGNTASDARNFFFVCVFSITANCLLSLNIFLPLSSLVSVFILALGIQVRTMASAGGPDNLVMLDPSKYKARPQVPEPAGDGSATQPKWQVGEQEYEALMRMLDNLVRKVKPFCVCQQFLYQAITN